MAQGRFAFTQCLNRVIVISWFYLSVIFQCFQFNYYYRLVCHVYPCVFVCLWVVSVCHVCPLPVFYFLFYFVVYAPSVFSVFTSCLCDCLHQSSWVPPVFNHPCLPCVYISLCASPCPCWFLVLMSVLSLSLCFISCARVPCFLLSLVSFPCVLCGFQFRLFCQIPLFVVFSVSHFPIERTPSV